MAIFLKLIQFFLLNKRRKKGGKLIAIYYLMRSRMANLYTLGTSADYTNFLMRLFRKKKPSAQQQTTSFESFVWKVIESWKPSGKTLWWWEENAFVDFQNKYLSNRQRACYKEASAENRQEVVKSLDILLRQIETFIKVCVAFVFWTPDLLIDRFY